MVAERLRLAGNRGGFLNNTRESRDDDQCDFCEQAACKAGSFYIYSNQRGMLVAAAGKGGLHGPQDHPCTTCSLAALPRMIHCAG